MLCASYVSLTLPVCAEWVWRLVQGDSSIGFSRQEQSGRAESEILWHHSPLQLHLCLANGFPVCCFRIWQPCTLSVSGKATLPMPTLHVYLNTELSRRGSDQSVDKTFWLWAMTVQNICILCKALCSAAAAFLFCFLFRHAIASLCLIKVVCSSAWAVLGCIMMLSMLQNNVFCMFKLCCWGKIHVAECWAHSPRILSHYQHYIVCKFHVSCSSG